MISSFYHDIIVLPYDIIVLSQQQQAMPITNGHKDAVESYPIGK